jgi:hypothetical protein
MSFSLTSGLAKVKLEAYSDKALTQSIGNNSFTALVNPESINETISICYKKQGVWRSGGNDRVFSHFAPQNFSLKFVLDGTGALGPHTLQKNYVWNLVQLFRHVTTYVGEDDTRPPFLKLSWGTLFIHCNLDKADIVYSMFDEKGTPIRATITATFKTFDDEVLSMQGSSASDAASSASKQANSLAAKASAAYGSAGMAAALAKVNGLTSPRSDTSSKDIATPPASSLTGG